MLFQSLDIMLS